MSKPQAPRKTTGAKPSTYNPKNGKVRMIDGDGQRFDVELSTLATSDARGNVTYAIPAAKVAAGWRYADDNTPKAA